MILMKNAYGLGFVPPTGQWFPPIMDASPEALQRVDELAQGEKTEARNRALVVVAVAGAAVLALYMLRKKAR